MTVAAGAGKPEMPGQVRWVPPDELEVHPAARLVPPLSSGELAGLRADIAASGVAEPVCLGQDGRVVDGRHRLAVARELGLPKIPVLPAICPLGGEAEYALRSALHRRSLSLDQRAVVAHRLAEVRGAERRRESARVASQVRWGDPSRTALIRDASRPPDSRTLAARELGVSERRLRLARELAQQAPDLVAQVEAGKLPLLVATAQVERRRAMAALAAAPKVDLPEGEAEVWCGDAMDLAQRLPPGCMDMVATDPPYKAADLAAWHILGQVAARLLKPSGWVVCYAGHLLLPVELAALEAAGLSYWWTGAVLLRGAEPSVHVRHVRTAWRVVLVFHKPPIPASPPWWRDLLTSPAPQKALHPWGQHPEPMRQILRRFALPGQLMMDPFCGSGSFLVAGIEAGCRVIGFERDPGHAEVARHRLAAAMAERDRQAEASA